MPISVSATSTSSGTACGSAASPSGASELGSLAGHGRGVLTLGAIDGFDRLRIRGRRDHPQVSGMAHRHRRQPRLPDRRQHSRAPGEELGGVPNGGPGYLRAVVGDQDRCRLGRHAPASLQ